MATHDYVIDNSTGANVRADINNALAAIVSNNSNSSEPSTKYAYMWWADTTNGILKIRNAANNAWVELLQLDGTLTLEDGSASTPGLAFRDDLNTGIFSSAADTFNVATAGVERMELGATTIFNEDGADVDFRIEGDSEANLFYVDAGNDRVGIGTSSPLRDLSIGTYGSGDAEIAFGSSTSGVASLLFGDGSTGTDVYRGYIQYNHSADALLIATAATERMRVDSSGNLLIACTDTNSNSSTGLRLRAHGGIHCTASGEVGLVIRREGSDGQVCLFRRDGNDVGSISISYTATAFNTSSDYRLKENVTAISDGITRLKTLKPSRFNFKVDKDTTVDGFLAHEVTAVPEAITGTKDAVATEDSEEAKKGDPIYQQIDQSKLVPLLTAALQEAIAKIEVLETKVAALEST